MSTRTILRACVQAATRLSGHGSGVAGGMIAQNPCWGQALAISASRLTGSQFYPWSMAQNHRTFSTVNYDKEVSARSHAHPCACMGRQLKGRQRHTCRRPRQLQHMNHAFDGSMLDNHVRGSMQHWAGPLRITLPHKWCCFWKPGVAWPGASHIAPLIDLIWHCLSSLSFLACATTHAAELHSHTNMPALCKHQHATLHHHGA